MLAVIAAFYLFDLFGLLQSAVASTNPMSKFSPLTFNASSNEFVFKKNTEIIYCLPLRGGSPIPGLTVTWYRYHTQIKDLKDSQRFEVLPDNSLQIKSPRREDSGVYTVVFHEANTDAADSLDGVNCSLGYYARPLVLHFLPSYNREEHDELNLGCSVLAYPPTVVFWFINDKLLSENDSRISLKPLGGHLNAFLTITALHMADAGIYNCTAYSFFFNASSSQTTRVRVADRQEFLIPLVALLAGIVILSLLILTFEANAKDRIRKKEEGLYRESFLNLQSSPLSLVKSQSGYGTSL